MSVLADVQIRALLSEVARRAGDYLAGLDERRVAPDSAALAGLSRFDEPLPESAGDAAATLALLDETGSPATVASAGGRYFGFVTGGSHPVALGANWLAAAWDQNAALPVMSPVAARLHEVVTRWLTELLGLPAGTLGRRGMTDLVVRTCDHAQAIAAYLRRAGLEVLNDVVLNQVLVRAATDDLTLALVHAVQQDGTCWYGPTTWRGRPAMRISVSGWATSGKDVRKSAEAIIAAAGRGR